MPMRPSLRVLAVTGGSEGEGWARDPLAGTPFEITCVPRLDLAEKTLSRTPYDVLLLDLWHGERDATALWAVAHAYRLAIVVVLGAEDDHFAQHALEAGIQECLVAGRFGPTDLARAIRHAAARHRLLAELRRVKREARGRRLVDPLTGLANRSALVDRLDGALRAAQHYDESPAVVVAGIDGFDDLDARLGRTRAGRLLCELGRRLGWCARRTDLVARLGTDRFAVLLRHAPDHRVVRATAEAMRTAIAAPVELASGAVRVTGSIGIACYPDDGDDASRLLAAAEAGMLEARRLGGNRCRLMRAFLAHAWPEAMEPRLGLDGATMS